MPKRLGVLTSGGDAQGSNVAIRATVRAALEQGAEVYGIYEGYQGMIDGGQCIRQVDWSMGGGILQKGGTIFGTARSAEFRTREGRRKAVRNLLLNGINRLVVIGGDGSLTGANILRQEWRRLGQELAVAGEVEQSVVDAHPFLTIVGSVGSIDNDMYGTDMTIGADSALHRITDAIDAITSTVASHQRAFVVEVMGRNCGYLALMGGLASGADLGADPGKPAQSGRSGRKDVFHPARRAQKWTSGQHCGGGRGRKRSPRQPHQRGDCTLGIAKTSGRRGPGDRTGPCAAGGIAQRLRPGAEHAARTAAAEIALASGANDEPVLAGMHQNKIASCP